MYFATVDAALILFLGEKDKKDHGFFFLIKKSLLCGNALEKYENLYKAMLVSYRAEMFDRWA